ncbi:MAG: dihydroorotase [Ruminococcaceae bacterium]|nr:dihydroorotase [Oscillospiraceae bacterium]
MCRNDRILPGTGKERSSVNRLLIKNSHVIDPSQGIDRVCDVLIENGLIAAVGIVPADYDGPVMDAAGLCLAPGLVDMHVHLRDPGFTQKEDILTGCAAAAAGGFTSIASMPNSNPVCDKTDVVKYIIGRSEAAPAKVYPVAAITKGLKSGELTDFASLHEAGAVGVSDDGRPVTNNRLMLEALRTAGHEHLVVICHAEDLDIVNGGIMHKGEISGRLKVPGIDRASEDCATAATVALAAASNTHVHIAHVSTKGSVELIRDAKRRGVNVTCETAPHYFALNHEMLLKISANYRMNPPLREESDRKAILDAIADGTIDCIATDHAPHTPYEKAEFETAPNGVIGLETSLAVSLTHLVHTGIITLSRLMELMSWTPAQILGIRAGTLKKGVPADLVLFDPEEKWVVDKTKFRSKARNTCFDKAKVTGRVRYTMLNGVLSYEYREETENGNGKADTADS